MLTEYFYIQLHQSTRVVLPLDNTAGVIALTRSEICPIPGVAPALLGVVNQRGRLLWVLELSDLLGLALSPKRLQSQEKLTLVVLTASSTNSTVGQAERQLGCVVSALKGIVTLDPRKFKPIPTGTSPSGSSFLSSLAEVEQLPAAVLNVNAVLAALQASVPTIAIPSDL